MIHGRATTASPIATSAPATAQNFHDLELRPGGALLCVGDHSNSRFTSTRRLRFTSSPLDAFCLPKGKYRRYSEEMEQPIINGEKKRPLDLAFYRYITESTRLQIFKSAQIIGTVRSYSRFGRKWLRSA